MPLCIRRLSIIQLRQSAQGLLSGLDIFPRSEIYNTLVDIESIPESKEQENWAEKY